MRFIQEMYSKLIHYSLRTFSCLKHKYSQDISLLAVNHDAILTVVPPMQASKISFTSLGLVVLDEIRCPDRKPLADILGGSGTYGEFPVSHFELASTTFD